MMSKKRVALGGLLFAAALVLQGATGCERSVNIKNNSGKNASVFVAIPEASRGELLHMQPGDDDYAELGDSGIYEVYVEADEQVTSTLKKLRDDIEAQLKTANSQAEIQDLTSKLQAVSKFADQRKAAITSCGGKVAEGDAYVTVGWDDAKHMFTAVCVSKSATDKGTNPGTNP